MLKKKFSILFVSFIFVIALISGILFFLRSDVSANDESVIRYEKVKIESGDTLWSIAEEYYQEPCGDIRDYVDRIKECNSLDSSEHITEGNYLCVPVYTSEIR